MKQIYSGVGGSPVYLFLIIEQIYTMGQREEM